MIYQSGIAIETDSLYLQKGLKYQYALRRLRSDL